MLGNITKSAFNLGLDRFFWLPTVGLLAMFSPALIFAEQPNVEQANSSAHGVAVTLDVDYSVLPQLTIHARDVSPDELMSSLAQKLGFSVKRIGRADPDARIRGQFVGELPDLLPILLRGEGYIATFGEQQPDGRRDLKQVFLLDSRSVAGAVLPAERLADSRGAGASTGDASAIRSYLEQHPTINNKDLRKYLSKLADQIESGETSAEVSINVTDAPQTVTEMLERINEPLAPDFGENRLENRGPGTPPRYLTGANDAAQNSVESALSRTSTMAIRNVEILSKALDRACLSEDCQGITREQMAQRQEAVARKVDKEKPTGD